MACLRQRKYAWCRYKMNAQLQNLLTTPVDKLSRPVHDLRVSVIEACNFRCPYCMPADKTPDDSILQNAARLSFDQIEKTVKAFVKLGVRKVRLTGGEPLLRKNLPELIERLSRISELEDIALTTNASLLEKQASALKKAGLHRLTVSLDALDANIFLQLSGGRGQVQDVLKGIEAAEAAGFSSLKINAVIQRGINESQVLPLVEKFRGTQHVLRFIEFMDVGNCNGWSMHDVVPSKQLQSLISQNWPLQPISANYRGEVASRYRFVDGMGEIGFVSSVSEPFCGDCHRARLSADGHVYTCLFAGKGHDIRAELAQSEEALNQRLAGIWTNRTDRYSEERHSQTKQSKKIEMYFIGG
jgi:GTP 3',8-cyclase